MRKFDTKYGVWLAGYYDDFTGARAIANDFNQPSVNDDYNHSLSHHGNALNGEATLNPRFRWAFVDRKRTSGSNFFSQATNKFLKNNGSFEWLGFDGIRMKPSTWHGRAQLQYPDGNTNANRYQFDGDNTEKSYQMFTNGYKTSDFYLIPTGNMDASFARTTIKNYSTTNMGTFKAGHPTTTKAPTDGFMRTAHLTGVWMGEALDVSNTTNDTPLNLFAPLKSASGKPFLCIRSMCAQNSDIGNVPTIYYEGSLNSASDNDVFSTRVAVRSHRGTNRVSSLASLNGDGKGVEWPTLQFHIGYSKPTTNLTNNRRINKNGFEGTPAINYTIDFYNHSLFTYDAYGAEYVGGVKQTYVNDDSWLDIDFVINYTTGKYRVFINGKEDTTHGGTGFNLAGSPTAANMYGWEMTLKPRNFTAEETGGNAHTPVNNIQYLMIDRVGLFHYISDALHFSSDETPLKQLQIDMNAGGLSNGSITLYDDPAYEEGTNNYGLLDSSYHHKLTNIVKNSNDWNILIFGNEDVNRRDRPIFKGLISNYQIKQQRNTRQIKIDFDEPSAYLETQLPLWEVGQKAVTDDSDSTPYWLFDAQGFKHLMNLGESKLKLLNPTLGFDVDDGYTERSDQRMQLNSSHPIQMYNNEDEFGPNDLEIYYEGARIKGIFEETISSTTYTVIKLGGNHGLSSGDSITITGSMNYDGTYTTAANTSGNKLYFAQGDMPYVPDAPKIFYGGRHVGAKLTYDNWVPPNGSALETWGWPLPYPNLTEAQWNHGVFLKLFVDADPGLKAGDILTINKNDQGNWYDGETIEVTSVEGPFRQYMPSATAIYPFQLNKGLYDTLAKMWIINTNYRLPYLSNSSSLTTGELGVYCKGVVFNGNTTQNEPEVTNASVNLISSGVREGWRIENIDGVSNGLPEEGDPWVITDVAANTLEYDNFNWANTTGQQHFVQGDGALLYWDGSATVDNRIRYCSDTKGVVTSSSFPQGFKHKALHAKWMRDLPLSLWFKYHFGSIQNVPISTGHLISAVTPSSTEVRITSEMYWQLKNAGEESGIGELVSASSSGDKVSHFIYRGLKFASPLSTDNRYYLTGVKFISKDFAGGAATKVNICRIYNDYKHLWILWADMRNNGDADADGGYRKDSFGLKYPTTENYDVSLFFTDSVTEQGKPTKFTDLKIGEDIDIWEVDATNDPSTGVAFSKPIDYDNSLLVEHGKGTDDIDNNGGFTRITKNGHGLSQGDYVYVWDIKEGGSLDTSGRYKVTNVSGDAFTIGLAWGLGQNGTTFGNDIYPSIWFAKTVGSSIADAKYQDWENKGGAFVIIDSSKFFNLNTIANGGRTGQDAGGQTRLEEFVASTRGHPALIDNYYQEAISHGKNVEGLFDTHPNSDKLLFDSTYLTSNVGMRHSAIFVNDVSQFPETGMGKLNVIKNTGGTRVDDSIKYYVVWGGKHSTKLQGTVTGFNAAFGSTSPTIEIIDINTDVTPVKNGMIVTHDKNGRKYRVINNGTAAGGGSGSNVFTLHPYDLDDNLRINSANDTAWQVGDSYTVDTQLYKTMIISPSEVFLRPESIFYEAGYGRATGELIFDNAPTTSSSTTDISTTNGATITIRSWFKNPKPWPTEDSPRNVRMGEPITYIFRSGLGAFGQTTTTENFNGAIHSSLDITDASDFPNTGKAWLYFSGDNYNDGGWKLITYTGKSGNKLTGITGTYFTYPSGTSIHASRKDPTHPQYVRVNGTGNTTAIATDLMAAINSVDGNNDGVVDSKIRVVQDTNRLSFEQTTIGSGGNSEIIVTKYGNQSDFTSQRGMQGGADLESIATIQNESTLPRELSRLYELHISNDRSYNVPIDLSQDSAVISNSLSPQYALRMMMQIEGSVRNKNAGTYFDNDKFRTLWQAASMNTWLPPTNINVPMDINNVPITTMMAYDGGATNKNDFGSTVDSRNKTLGATIAAVKKTSGYSDEGNYMPFTKVMGRDGRLDFRPKFNSGIALDRTSVRLSNIEGGVVSKISNVRVYYDDGASFVDYPSTSVQDTSKWKVFQYPKIKSSLEALKLAKRQYSTLKDSPLQIKLSPILQGNVDRMMLQSGRFGYIADPYRISQIADGATGANEGVQYWSRVGTGGCLFPGQVNAMDGNLGKQTTLAGSKNRQGRSDQKHATNDLDYFSQYFYYGANSLAYAAQVVHIPNNTPFVSNTSGNELRVFISLKNGQTGSDIDTAKFVVWLVDYNFTDNHLKNVDSVAGHSSKNIYGSGFYEIPIPDSYDGGGGNNKIVLSVNVEYLKSLLRHRCGEGTTHLLKNAHVLEDGSSTTALSSISTHADASTSIFPLGGRQWSTVLPNKGFFQQRTSWYAPRINVTRDMSYWPGTYITYTDKGIDLDNEVLTIQEIRWQFDNQQKEKLAMTLERDISFASQSVSAYLFPSFPHNTPVTHDSPTEYVPPSFPQTVGSGTQTIDSDDWIAQNPADQGNQTGIYDNTGNAFTEYRQSQSTFNQIGSGAWADIRGFGSMTQDLMGSRGQFGILGQERPPKISASVRGIDVELEFTPSEGTVTKAKEGYAFPGNTLPGGETGYVAKNSMEAEFSVPKDILSDQMEISAAISHGEGDLSIERSNNLLGRESKALMTTKIENITKGTTFSSETQVNKGMSNARTYLFPTQRVTGMSAGDRIRVTITRDPNNSSDTSNYSAVTLHGINVGLQRANNTSFGTTSSLTPYE